MSYASGMNRIYIAILLIIAIVEGLYIYRTHDLKKRILLPNYFYYDSLYTAKEQPNDYYVSVKGSWISDTELADPIQTINLFCYKPTMECTLTDATVQESNSFFLSTNTDTLEISQWKENVISTKPKIFACVDYIYQIDRKKEMVTSIRRTTSTSGACNGVKSEPIIMTLGDGYKRIK